MRRYWVFAVIGGLCALCLVVAGCPRRGAGGPGVEKTDRLILAAYSAPQDAYHRGVIPAFQRRWIQDSGRGVVFEEHYEASAVQAQKVIDGLEADVVALSLEPDLVRVQEAGLITHDWQTGEQKGVFTMSVPVICYHAGEERKFADWEDLAREGVKVVYPDPRTSGMGRWVVISVYGAGLKRSAMRASEGDRAAAEALLERLQRNVVAMPKSAREALEVFDKGTGDVLITYEEEALHMRALGKTFPYAVPRVAAAARNPVAVVDAYVDRHGTRKVAEAFVEFLASDEAQRAFAEYGYRPAKKEIAAEFASRFPEAQMLFEIDYLGRWAEVDRDLFGPDGVWTRVMGRVGR